MDSKKGFDNEIANFDKPENFNDNPQKVQLKREIGLWSAVGLIISSMIGSGIFISPSFVLKRTGSVALCLIIWIFCGIFAYLSALVLGELSSLVGESGGPYAYYEASFGKLRGGKTFLGHLPSFLYCFISIFLTRPASTATLLLTSSEYIIELAAEYVPEENHLLYKKSFAIIGLAIITIIICMSVKWYLVIVNLFSSLKVLACFIIVCGGIYFISTGRTENLSKGFEGSNFSFKEIALAFYSGLWAYDGWAAAIEVTEEIKSPHKNIPWSLSIGITLIMFLYISMNISYMAALTIPEIIHSPAVAIGFVKELYNPLTFVITAAVVFSTFSSAMSNQFGVSRLCYAAAKNGHAMESLSYIHTKRSTPIPAVIFEGLLAALYIASGSILELMDFINFIVLMFYALNMVTVFILRKTMPDSPRLYKVPLIIPFFIMAICCSLTVIAITLSANPLFLIALGAILIGIIIYYPLVYKRIHLSCMEKFNEYVKKCLNVAPPYNLSL